MRQSIKVEGKLAVIAAMCAAGALMGGCSQNSVPTTEAVAQPIATPTAKPTPKPTPLPTAKPKGIGLFSVKTKQKVFALTFDDGPDPSYTPRIVKILQEKKVPATFFMVGAMVRAHAPTGMLVVKAGYPIGGHTWTHPMRTKRPAWEVDHTDAMIKEKLGITTTMFRPPYGIRTNGLASVASARGEDVIIWSSDSDDWNHHTNASIIHNNVMRNAGSGGIALMHDGGGNRSATVVALPGIIDALKNRGFKLVTVPQLMAMGKPVIARIGPKSHGKTRKHQTKVVAMKNAIAPTKVAPVKATPTKVAPVKATLTRVAPVTATPTKVAH